MTDEIKAHAGELLMPNFEVEWRPPQLEREPYGETFRSCSYCGSIHPEDLVTLLEAGAKASGADWKYGWPHKFYVDNIPNPHAGKPVEMGSRSADADTPGAVWKPTCGHADCTVRTSSHGYWNVPTIEPAPATMCGKFYNTHLQDCSPEVFARLAPLLKQHTGIAFSIDPEKGVGYHAPSVGHQQ